MPPTPQIDYLLTKVKCESVHMKVACGEVCWHQQLVLPDETHGGKSHAAGGLKQSFIYILFTPSQGKYG